ncbi:MAG TPA: TetR/AcrR family transcriptional regulator C-terminal domain-containing protein, partial [Verrucomicrobiae bacterium]|nr:TetR/AcrR family transcriptional regulator C-terminal domain-containing protein [Verrucomicrobiae bacterium]
AKVADGTIYLYFENKDDILISLFREKMGQFIADLQQELTALPRAQDKILKIVGSHLAYLGADRYLAEVTQVQLRQSNPVIRQGISEPLILYFKLIEEAITLGQTQGAFTADIDVKTARKLVFDTLDEVVTSWVMAGAKKSLDSYGDMIYRLFMNGLSK